MNKKVLGIGEIVIDKVCQIASFPLEGEKIVAQDSQLSLGGPVPAALILLSRLGVECALAATIGMDEPGRIAGSILEKEGVYVLPQKSEQTTVHTVLVNRETGSRTIVKDLKKSDKLRPISKEVVRSVDLLLCDRHEPAATIRALKDCHHTTSAIMDPSTDCSSQTMQILKSMDFPIVPLETLQILFPRKAIKESARSLSLLLGKAIVVTMGKYGCGVYDDESFVIHPSHNIHAIDTLGAGDIFRGGFAYGVLNGWTIHQCAKFANSVAALQCTKVGNSSAIPTKEEIFTFHKWEGQLQDSSYII